MYFCVSDENANPFRTCSFVCFQFRDVGECGSLLTVFRVPKPFFSFFFFLRFSETPNQPTNLTTKHVVVFFLSLDFSLQVYEREKPDEPQPKKPKQPNRTVCVFRFSISFSFSFFFVFRFFRFFRFFFFFLLGCWIYTGFRRRRRSWR